MDAAEMSLDEALAANDVLGVADDGETDDAPVGQPTGPRADVQGWEWLKNWTWNPATRELTKNAVILPERDIWGEFRSLMQKPPDKSRLIKTGLPALDKFLGGGFAPKTMNTVAAESGAGKTILLGNIAVHAASKGAMVFYALLEGAVEDFQARLVAAYLGVSTIDILDHMYGERRQPPEMIERYEEASAHLASLPLIIRDDLTTIQEIGDYAKETDAKVAIVDSLQIVRPAGSSKARGSRERVEETSGLMRDLAKDRGLIVLTASEIARPEKRDEVFVPNKWSIRESEQVRYDSTQMLLMSRATGRSKVIRVDDGKYRQRAGNPSLYLGFDGAHSRVTDGAAGLEALYLADADEERQRLKAEKGGSGKPAKEDKGDRSRRIEEWLVDFLSRGPQERLAVEQAGWGDGYKFKAQEIERVAERIGVQRVQGVNGARLWSLRESREAY